MRSLIVFAGLLAIVVAEFAHQDPPKRNVMRYVQPYVKSCLRDFPIRSDQVQRLTYSDFSDGPKPALQCFLHCCLERLELYNPDGTLNTERAIQRLSYPHQDEHAHHTMEVCKHVTGQNECDTAYQVYKCFKQSIIHQ